VEVQPVPRAGARTVVFVFSGRHYRHGVPFTLLHRWFGRLDASIVYLRDGSRRGFLRGIRSLGVRREAATSALRAIAAELGAERIVCFGSSTGGFAALLYAVELEAEAAALMSGVTDLSFLDAPPLAQPAWAAIRNLAVVLGAAPRPPQALFVGADGSKRDDRQAKNIANLPSVTVRMLERYDGRLTVPELICRGQFDRVLDWLMTARSGGTVREIGQFGYFPWREVFA
jgi:pimeloyl-ACP methyl ester carboxylesterase